MHTLKTQESFRLFINLPQLWNNCDLYFQSLVLFVSHVALLLQLNDFVLQSFVLCLQVSDRPCLGFQLLEPSLGQETSDTSLNLNDVFDPFVVTFSRQVATAISLNLRRFIVGQRTSEPLPCNEASSISLNSFDASLCTEISRSMIPAFHKALDLNSSAIFSKNLGFSVKNTKKQKLHNFYLTCWTCVRNERRLSFLSF